MSKYIKEVGFDFIYLYDPEQILNKKHFSKDTIYSVLFDSKGDIQQIDYSGKLNHDKILNQLDEPTNKTSRSIPLLNFQIKRFELGDEVTSNLNSANIPTKLMTGYKVDENIDTIESIKFYTLTGENILGLYSHAYNLPKNRIIYDKELEYINSHAPNHRYTLSLSVSNLHADFNKMLIQQIDLNFGMESSLIIKETESLILSQIDLEKDKIKRANPLDKNKTLNKTISETKFQLKSDNINALEISRLIEETTKFPVEIKFDPNLSFSIDISIENNDKTIDNWIKLFSENGLNLDREMKKVK